MKDPEFASVINIFMLFMVKIINFVCFLCNRSSFWCFASQNRSDSTFDALPLHFREENPVSSQVQKWRLGPSSGGHHFERGEVINT